MPELAEAEAAKAAALAKFAATVERLGGLEAEVEQARLERQEDARAAHRLGASYAELGRIGGLSRQRVATIIED
jgi:hypothetical protein